MHYDLVAGWTGPVDFQLLSNGSAIDLTGATVTMLIRNTDTGALIDQSGTLSVLSGSETSGRVRWSPTVAGPCACRFHIKITSGGKDSYCPSEGFDTVTFGATI